ncbi:MAG: CPBP family intramembrane metalloprotease, partial [Actinomycetota bacterium]|nr:CPBP family intramembrane metalloprotease [Actinomycetota bacterium]
VCEELLFRGLLLRALRRRMSPEMAVIVQALAFALAHPMLSPTLGDFAVVPALFLLGAVSGVVAVRRGDLSASIMMHIGFNLVTTLLAL